MQAITALLLVGIGGFAGAIARWGIGTAIKTTLGEPAFPYPTMIVNLLGCFAIGIAYSIWEANNALNLVIIIGFLGGFTTFSTFGLETLTLIRNGSIGSAAVYVGISSVLGVILVWTGLTIAK